MFSPPCVAPCPQARSRVGPLVCEREPCAMMRSAFCTATAARHELQLSGANAAAARSWLISVCCADTSAAASAGLLEGKRLPATSSAAHSASSLLTPVQRGRRGPVCAFHGAAPRLTVALRCVTFTWYLFI